MHGEFGMGGRVEKHHVFLGYVGDEILYPCGDYENAISLLDKQYNGKYELFFVFFLVAE